MSAFFINSMFSLIACWEWGQIRGEGCLNGALYGLQIDIARGFKLDV